MTGDVLLSVEDLTKDYPWGLLWLKHKRVLHGVSFSVSQGEITALLGHNGAGKSTTFKILMGFLRADGGRVLYRGEPLSRRARSYIGFLPENPAFYDYLTGRELLRFTAELFSLKRFEGRIDHLLRLVKMEEAANLPLKKYSKGMVQRIGVAQALVSNPELLILDEPLDGLDPEGRQILRNLIVDLKEEGKTVLYSTHILQDAERISDRAVILVKGKTVKEGRIEDLLGGETSEYEVSFKGLREAPPGAKGRWQLRGDTLYGILEKEEEVQPLVQECLRRGGQVLSLVPLRRTLEEIFMELKDESNGSRG